MSIPQNVQRDIIFCEKWIDELENKPAISSPDEAYTVLGAVLRTLRDYLPLEERFYLSERLPVIIRGLYFEECNSDVKGLPLKRSEQGFYDALRNRLHGKCHEISSRMLSQYVFSLLNRYLAPAEVNLVRSHLPEDLQQQWPNLLLWA